MSFLLKVSQTRSLRNKGRERGVALSFPPVLALAHHQGSRDILGPWWTEVNHTLPQSPHLLFPSPSQLVLSKFWLKGVGQPTLWGEKKSPVVSNKQFEIEQQMTAGWEVCSPISPVLATFVGMKEEKTYRLIVDKPLVSGVSWINWQWRNLHLLWWISSVHSLLVNKVSRLSSKFQVRNNL